MNLRTSLQQLGMVAVLGLAVMGCPSEDNMQLKTPPPVPDRPSGRTMTSVAGGSTDSGVAQSGNGPLATGASGAAAGAAGAAGGGAGVGAFEAGSSGAATSGSGGAAGALAAGSGGAGGAAGKGPTAGRTAGAGAAGAGGVSGAGGDSANTLPPACRDQFCLDVTACWFFIGPDCGYTSCTNFTCM